MHTYFWLKLLYLGYAGGKPLLELNRILRPGGYYIWSATPVYRKDPRDIDDWNGLWPLLSPHRFFVNMKLRTSSISLLSHSWLHTLNMFLSESLASVHIHVNVQYSITVENNRKKY